MTAIAIRARALIGRVPVVLVLLFAAVTVVGPVVTASPARADLCAEAPVPANPWDDDLSQVHRPPLNDDGSIASEQPNTAFGAERDTSLAKMYGTDYTFFAYDASCNWGTDSLFSFGAASDTKIFKWATYPFAFAYASTVIAMDSGWKESLDGAVSDVVSKIGKDIFNAAAGLMIAAAAVVALLAARTGDISRAFTQLMWVLALVGVAAISIGNPSVFTKTADDAVLSVMNTAGSAIPATRDDLAEASAQEKVLSNLDTINNDVYYRAWLQGELGSADGVAATNYGATLFNATHLTWWEGKIVRDDPAGEGQKIIDRKQQDFKDTVDKIEKEDPTAFEYIKGRNVNRMGTTISAILQAWLSLPFYIVAMCSVGVALLTIRIAVMLLPVLALAGLFEPTRFWMLGILQKYSGNIVRAPMAFAAALVNVAIVGALFQGDMPIFGKVLVSVIVMVILWTIAKPQVLPAPIMRTGMSVGRRALSLVAAKKVLDATDRPKGNDRDDDNSASRSRPSNPTGPSGGGGQGTSRGQLPVAPVHSRAALGAPPVREPVEVTAHRVETEPLGDPVPVRRRIDATRTPSPRELPAAGNAGAASDGATTRTAAGNGTVRTTLVTTAPQGAPADPWTTPAPGTEKPSSNTLVRYEVPASRWDAQGGSTSTAETPHPEAATGDNEKASAWQPGYERVELRRAPVNEGVLQGDAIFMPRSSAANAAHASANYVSDGNTTWRDGEASFEVWTPPTDPAATGGAGDRPRGTGRAA